MTERPTTGNERAAELARLCRSCGMCCDGSLFGRVDLDPEEVEPARRRRLQLVPSSKAFEQPCAALVTATSGEHDCSIYDERPCACRRFRCRLYDRHEREGGPIDARLAVVRRARALAAELEASGRTPADLDEDTGPTGTSYRELTRSLEDDFARA